MEQAKITIELPIELYDKIVLRSRDSGQSKDAIIINALSEYLSSNYIYNAEDDDYLFYENNDDYDKIQLT